jgi:iron complex transport system permease protein
MHRHLPLFPALALLLLAAAGLLALSLASGSLPLSFADVAGALRPGEPSLARDVIFELRLPRALSAFAVGGLLALAGALLQALLRNPLADPYVLGVSGGASVAAFWPS